MGCRCGEREDDGPMGLRSTRGRCSTEERSRALQHTATTQRSEEKEEAGREAKAEGTQARCKKPYSEAERRDGEEGEGTIEVREPYARPRNERESTLAKCMSSKRG